MQSPISQRLSGFVLALQDRAKLQVRDVAEEVPFRSGLTTNRLDALVSAASDDGAPLWLAVEELNFAFPRDIRTAIGRLRAYEDGTDHHPLAPCVIASELSPGARQLLREANVNFFDDSGTLYFQNGNCLIDIERPSKGTKLRRIGNLFTDARERVVHAVLDHWRSGKQEGWFSGAAIASRSDTSSYTVSTTLQEMERHDLLETEGKGPAQKRRLANPVRLMDDWVAHWAARDVKRSHWYLYAGKSGPTDKLIPQLQRYKRWALTGAAVANAELAHLTSVDRTVVIVPFGAGVRWGDELGLERAEKGSNIVFVEREGAALMFPAENPKLPGAVLASPFITYLDLRDGYGRNKELAAEFRSRVLKLEP
jgi:hypothetical protein